MTLHYLKLRREDIQPILTKLSKEFVAGGRRLFSYEAKLVLLRTCIASVPMFFLEEKGSCVPMYLMSIIKFPQWAIKVVSSQMTHFLWGNVGDVPKYHLANWGLVSPKIEFGGQVIPNFR